MGKRIGADDVRQILEVLSALESTFMHYHKDNTDYSQFQIYYEYFSNPVITEWNLSRIYFDIPVVKFNNRQSVLEYSDVPGSLVFHPEYALTIHKLLNFPGNLRHKCDYFSLLYQLKGKGGVHLDKETIELADGDFIFVAPNVYHSFSHEPNSIMLCIDIRISYWAKSYPEMFLNNPLLNRFATDALSPDHGDCYLALHTESTPMVQELALSILAEYLCNDEYSSIVMENLLKIMFAVVLRKPDNTFRSSVKVSRKTEHYHEILTYMKRNYLDVSLSSVAQAVHFSKQHICTIIRDESGQTFHSLLMQIRLGMVKHYLIESRLALENIAELCGFATAAHLSRSFKAHFGITPSAFRATQSKVS